ncbi:MAG: VOC family protein [Bryobacteraceae bacterium]
MDMFLAWYPVTDMDRAKDFYGNTLGLKKTYEMPGWVEFSGANGSASVGLSLVKDAAPAGGGATVVFRVPDIEESRLKLESLGVAFEGKVEEIPGVVRIGTFRDPFQNRVQLAQVLVGK